MRAYRVVVLLLMVLSVGAYAQTVGKYAGEFMSIGVGARALGMGSAHVALASDAAAGYWNPGALARINFPDFVVMHDERFGSLVSYDFAAVAIPYGTDVSLGLGVLRLGVDGVPDTRNAWFDVNGNGSFDKSDQLDYGKITYFNASDWAIYGTYAKRSTAEFMYGASVKIIRRSLVDESATGIGFDVGAVYSPTERLFLGINAQDITTTLVAWSTGRTELISPTLKIGAAYSLDLLGGRLTPVFDVDMRFENRRFAAVAAIGPVSLDPRFGMEFDYKSTVALRAGYNDVKQLSLGAGLHLRMLDIDYSFARFSGEESLGNTHRISLRFVLIGEQFGRPAAE
jgi:hypothetical protein